jgi:hypothetical protein
VDTCEPFAVLYSFLILYSGKEGGKISAANMEVFSFVSFEIFSQTDTFKRCVYCQDPLLLEMTVFEVLNRFFFCHTLFISFSLEVIRQLSQVSLLSELY